VPSRVYPGGHSGGSRDTRRLPWGLNEGGQTEGVMVCFSQRVPTLMRPDRQFPSWSIGTTHTSPSQIIPNGQQRAVLETRSSDNWVLGSHPGVLTEWHWPFSNSSSGGQEGSCVRVQDWVLGLNVVYSGHEGPPTETQMSALRKVPSGQGVSARTHSASSLSRIGFPWDRMATCC
jgi:hypothetical protein